MANKWKQFSSRALICSYVLETWRARTNLTPSCITFLLMGQKWAHPWCGCFEWPYLHFKEVIDSSNPISICLIKKSIVKNTHIHLNSFLGNLISFHGRSWKNCKYCWAHIAPFCLGLIYFVGNKERIAIKENCNFVSCSIIIGENWPERSISFVTFGQFVRNAFPRIGCEKWYAVPLF